MFTYWFCTPLGSIWRQVLHVLTKTAFLCVIRMLLGRKGAFIVCFVWESECVQLLSVSRPNTNLRHRKHPPLCPSLCFRMYSLVNILLFLCSSGCLSFMMRLCVCSCVCLSPLISPGSSFL